MTTVVHPIWPPSCSQGSAVAKQNQTWGSGGEPRCNVRAKSVGMAGIEMCSARPFWPSCGVRMEGGWSLCREDGGWREDEDGADQLGRPWGVSSPPEDARSPAWRRESAPLSGTLTKATAHSYDSFAWHLQPATPSSLELPPPAQRLHCTPLSSPHSRHRDAEKKIRLGKHSLRAQMEISSLRGFTTDQTQLALSAQTDTDATGAPWSILGQLWGSWHPSAPMIWNEVRPRRKRRAHSYVSRRQRRQNKLCKVEPWRS